MLLSPSRSRVVGYSPQSALPRQAELYGHIFSIYGGAPIRGLNTWDSAVPRAEPTLLCEYVFPVYTTSYFPGVPNHGPLLYRSSRKIKYQVVD